MAQLYGATRGLLRGSTYVPANLALMTLTSRVATAFRDLPSLLDLQNNQLETSLCQHKLPIANANDLQPFRAEMG